MLTEQEILDRYIQSTKEAKDCAVWLGGQADAGNMAPRGSRYARLREALRRMEGCCRQMAHWRADARWLKLSIVWGKAQRLVQAKFVGQRWAAFSAMVPYFDNAIFQMESLRDRKTGKTGAILPTPGAMDWVRVPDWVNPTIQSPYARALARQQFRRRERSGLVVPIS